MQSIPGPPSDQPNLSFHFDPITFRAQQTNLQPLERPPMNGPSSSEASLMRNGTQTRHQSPPTLNHSPFSYPAGGASAPSLSANMQNIQAPQPRHAASANGTPNGEWSQTPLEKPPPLSQSPSRPGSSRPSSYAPRTSGEGPPPFVNGNPTAQPVRQRI